MSQGVGPATDNPVAYISHHLQPLTAGSGFWQINIDTMFFSILIMLGVMTVAYRVGRNVTAGAPTGMQNVLETLIDFVNGLVKEAFPKPNKLVGPLGLTIFLWVFLMNAMDLVPVDLLPKLAHMMGIEYLKEAQYHNLNPNLKNTLDYYNLGKEYFSVMLNETGDSNTKLQQLYKALADLDLGRTSLVFARSVLI